jgi:hypothetical protein
MIPDAVAAIIAAAIREHPTNAPEAQARFAVTDLQAEGWHIVAPDVANAALRAA